MSKIGFYIIIRGPLGCGKSTISKELAKTLNAEYISIDQIVDDPALIKREKEEGYISQNNFKEANKIILPKLKKILDEGNIAIIDGNFYWKSQIEDLIDKLKKYDGHVFTLIVDLKTCLERDSKRAKSYGEIATKVVYKKTTSFDYGTNIDVSKSLKECIEEIVRYVKK